MTTNIMSDSFKKSLSSEYRLSLKVGINGISYVIEDNMGKIMAIRRFSSSDTPPLKLLKTIFTGDDCLSLKFRQSKIMLDSHLFTLIPERLFQENDRKLYLSNTAQTSNNHSFGDDKINFNLSRLVYAYDMSLISVLKNYFPSARMFHKTTALLLGWHKQAEIKKGEKVFVDVEENVFTISFYNENSLVFINRFEYQTAEDFLYYVLLIYDRFELRPSQTPTILSGFIAKNSDIYRQLYKYIRHLLFISHSPYYEIEKTFEKVEHHYYFDIYSLKLCE